MHCAHTIKPNASSSNRFGIASLLGAPSRLPSAKGASRVDAIGSRPRRRFTPIEHDTRLDPREIQASSIDGTAANSPQQLAPGLLAEANAHPRDAFRSLQQNALPADTIAPGPQHGPGTTSRGAARLPARLVLLAADNAASLPSQLLRQLVQGIQRAAAEGRDIRLPREAVERLLRELRTRRQLSVQHGVPDEVWGGGSLTPGDPGPAATAATTSNAAGGPAAGDGAVCLELGGSSAYRGEESPADVQPQQSRPRGRRRQLVSADAAVASQAQAGSSGAAAPPAAAARTAIGLRGPAGPPAPELQAQLLAHQEQLLQQQLLHGGGDNNGLHAPPSPTARGHGSRAGSFPGATKAAANAGSGHGGAGAGRGSEGGSWSFMEDLHEAVRRGGHGQLPPEEALAALEACAAVRALPLRPVYDELLRAVRWAAVTASATRRAAEADAAAEAEGRRRERIGGVWLGAPVEEAARAVEADRLGPDWAEQGRQRQHNQVAVTEENGRRELQVAGAAGGTAPAAAAAAATAGVLTAVAAGGGAPAAAAAAIAPRDRQAAQQLPEAPSSGPAFAAALAAAPVAVAPGPGTALQPRPVPRRAVQPPEHDPRDPPASSSHASNPRTPSPAAPAAPGGYTSPRPARPPQQREPLQLGAAPHTSRPLPPRHPSTASPNDPANRQAAPYLLPPTRLVSVLCGLTRLGQRLSQPLWHDLLSYLQPALSFVNSQTRHPRSARPGALAHPPPLPLSHYDLVDLASALASAGCNPSTSLLAAHAAACHGWARHLSGRQAARLLLSYSSLDYLPPKPLVGALAATVRTQLQWLDRQHVAAAAQGLVLMAAAMGLAQVHVSSSGAEGGVETGGLEDTGNGAAGSGSNGGSGSRAGGSTAVRYLLAAAAECVLRHAQLCAEERAALEQQQQEQQQQEELGRFTPDCVGFTAVGSDGMGDGGGGGTGGGMAELLPLDDLQAWLPDASLFLRPSGQGQPASPGTGPAAGPPGAVAHGSGVAASTGRAAQRVEEVEQQEVLLGWLAAAVPLPCGSTPGVPEGVPQPQPDSSPPSSPVLRLALAAGTDSSTDSTRSSNATTTYTSPLSGATAGSAPEGSTPDAWRRLPLLPPGLAPNGLAAACRLVLALGPGAEREGDSAHGPLLTLAWAVQLLSLAAAHAAQLLPSDLVPVVQVTCRVYGMYPELLQAAGNEHMESRQTELALPAGGSSTCSSDGGSGLRSGAARAGDTLLQLLTAAGACVEQLSYGQVVGLRECVGLLATDPRVGPWLQRMQQLEVRTELAGGAEAEGGRAGLGSGHLQQGPPAASSSPHGPHGRPAAGSAVTMHVAFGTFTADCELLREVAEALLDNDGSYSRGGGAHPRAVRPEDVPPEPPPGGMGLGAQRVGSQPQLHQQQQQGAGGQGAPEEDPRRWLIRLLRAHGERPRREACRASSSAARDAAPPELLPPPRRSSTATANAAPVAAVQPLRIRPTPDLAPRPAVPHVPPATPAAAPALRALIHVLHCCTEARVSLPQQQLQAMRLTWQRLLGLGSQQQPPATLAPPAQVDSCNAQEGTQRTARLSTDASATSWAGSERQAAAPCDPALCVELLLAVAAAAPRGGTERAAAVLELAAALGGAWAAVPPQLFIACLQVVAPAALALLPTRPPPPCSAPERHAAEPAMSAPADTPAAASLMAVHALLPLLRELHRRVATEPWQLPPSCLQPLLRMLSQLSYRPWLPRTLARCEAALTAEFVSLAAAAPGSTATAAGLTDSSIRAAVGAAVRRAAEQFPMPSSLAAVQYGIWVVQHFGVRVEKGALRRLSAAAGACLRLMHPTATVHLLQVCMSYGVAPPPRVMRATWEHVRYHWRRMGVQQMCGVVWSAARLGLRVPRDVQMAACLVAVTSVQQQQQQQQQQQAGEGMGSHASDGRGNGAGPSGSSSGSSSSSRPSIAEANEGSACSPADIVRLLWAVAYDDRCQPPANQLAAMCDALAEAWRALRPAERAAALWALARMDAGQVVVDSRLSHAVLSQLAGSNGMQICASATTSLPTLQQQSAVKRHAVAQHQGQPGHLARPARDPRVGGEPPGDLARECWAVAKLRLPVPPRLAAHLLAELRAAAAAGVSHHTGHGSGSSSGSTFTTNTGSAAPEQPLSAHQPHPAQPPALDLKESVQALYAATRLYGELRKQARQERRARQAAGGSPPQPQDTRPQAPQAAPTARPPGASGASSNAAGAEHGSAEAVLQVLYDRYGGSAGLLEPLFATVLATDPWGGAARGAQGAHPHGPALNTAAASTARPQQPLDIRTLADGLGALSRCRNDLAAHRQRCHQVQPSGQRGGLSPSKPAAHPKGTSGSAPLQSDGSSDHARANTDRGPDPWVVSALVRAEELLQYSAIRGLGDRPAPAWAVIEVLQAASYMGAPLSGGLLAGAAAMLQMHLPYMGRQQLAGVVCLAGLQGVGLPVELVAAAVRRLAGVGTGDGPGSRQEEQRLQYAEEDGLGCAVELEADELARVVLAAGNVLGGTTGAGEALGAQHGSGDAGSAAMAPDELAMCVSRLVCGSYSRTPTSIGKPTTTTATTTIAGRRSRGAAPVQVRLDPRLAAMTFDQLSMATHGTVAAGAVPDRRWLAAVVGLAGAQGRLSDASGHGLVRMAEALEAAEHWPGKEWMDAVMDQAMQLRRCHVIPRDALLRLKASLSRLRTLPAATRPFVHGAAPNASTTATAASAEATSSVPASTLASSNAVSTPVHLATDLRHSARVSTSAFDATGTQAPSTDDIHQTSPSQPGLLPHPTPAALIPSYAASGTSVESYSSGALPSDPPLPTPLPELLEAEAQRALGLAAELHRAFAAAALALARLAAAHCGPTAPRHDQQLNGAADAGASVPSASRAASARGRSVTRGSALDPLLLLSQLAVARVDRVLALALKVAVLRSAHVLHSLRPRQPQGGQPRQYLTDTARPLALGEQLRGSGREHAGLLQLGLGGRGGAGPLVLWRGEERGRQEGAAVDEGGLCARQGIVSSSDSTSNGRGESVVALARCGTPEVAGWRSMAAYLQGQQGHGTGAEVQPAGMGSARSRGRGAVAARPGAGSVQALAGGEAEMGLMVCLLHAKYVGALAQAFADRG